MLIYQVLSDMANQNMANQDNVNMNGGVPGQAAFRGRGMAMRGMPTRGMAQRGRGGIAGEL